MKVNTAVPKNWKQGFVVALVPVAVVGLSGCGKDEPAPEPAPPNSTAPVPETTGHSETSTSAQPTTSESTPRATTKATSEVSTTSKADSELDEVTQMYGSLAPAEFFEMFEDCAPNGIPDSSACTGPEVGQFQFFKGDAKAASTTQLLTELRSSRVVEDSGDRIVGWSTLGTTAVITVVDNEKGLTMQQMVSSDKMDPLKRIYELGLAKQEETSTPTPTEKPV